MPFFDVFFYALVVANVAFKDVIPDRYIVDPETAESVAAGIEAALTDSSLRKMLKEKGLENIRRFDWDKTAVELIKVFENL